MPETLSDLKPNPSNPRKISEEQLTRLKKSIDKFGDLSGFVFNRTTQQLVGGHQRAKVFPSDAIIEIVEVFQNPTETGTIAQGFVVSNGERFAYREVVWDELTEKTANVAANQHGGEFDLSKLSEWVLELDQNNIDLDLIGFSEVELQRLMAPVFEVNSGDENSEWAGMPDFEIGEKEIRLTIVFKTELERQSFTEKHSLPITAKHSGQWLSRI